MPDDKLDALIHALTSVNERIKWVILMGGFLATTLLSGFAYQVTINQAATKEIQRSQATLMTHLEAVAPIHNALIDKWIQDE